MAPTNQSLIDALLACPSISDKEKREAVIDDLPTNIKHNITRNSSGKFDVRNLVVTCQNYKGGLQALVEIIERFEGDSRSLQTVKQLVESHVSRPQAQLFSNVPAMPNYFSRPRQNAKDADHPTHLRRCLSPLC